MNAVAETVIEVLEDFGNPLWRLSNLYMGIDDDGKEFRFRPNDAQLQIWHDMHSLNVILKSRQWGFTTWIDVIALDACLWNKNYTAGIIAHTLPDADSIFRRKVLYPYEKLPPGLLDEFPIRQQQSKSIVWKHGSEISVSTSMRSTTLQFLHVSEFGKISAANPRKAIEVISGSLPSLNLKDAVEADGDSDDKPVVIRAEKMAFIESTAEGRNNAFHKIVTQARHDAERKKTLSAKEFKFHFFPWFEKKSNVADAGRVEVTAEVAAYYAKLETDLGITLSREQKAWYASELKALGDWDVMKREHPSTPDEPFEVAIIGAYYGEILSRMRKSGRIGYHPHVESEKVFSFWDLGHNDVTATWFAQHVGGEWRFVRYLESHGVDEMAELMEDLRIKHKYRFGPCYLPHDGDSKNSAGLSARDRLEDHGYRVEIVDRVDDLVLQGIPAVKRVLPATLIDVEGCDLGLTALENYQRKWNEKQGFLNYPMHNHASNGADAYRQFAQTFDRIYLETTGKRKPKKTGNWRTA